MRHLIVREEWTGQESGTDILVKARWLPKRQQLTEQGGELGISSLQFLNT
jgi:hypothetical protein